MTNTDISTEQSKEHKATERRLEKRFRKALTDYALIADGDKVLVALSGGKDSLFLLEMLAKRSHIFKPRFSVEAVYVRMRNIQYESDCTYLHDFASKLGITLHVVETEFDPSTDKRKSPCFLCSWYRRKAIFRLAQDLGCNKLALGHHNDDIIHTALMNLFFHGSLSSMPPSKPLDKMPITIIRPLCLEHEEDIARHAASAAYQKQKKLCPYERDSHRSDIAHIYRTVEAMSPEARFSIWHALGYDNATSTQSTPPLSPITPI